MIGTVSQFVGLVGFVATQLLVIEQRRQLKLVPGVGIDWHIAGVILDRNTETSRSDVSVQSSIGGIGPETARRHADSKCLFNIHPAAGD